MCVYLYIHNKYTQYTHIYYVNKNLFWMWLIVINRLTALNTTTTTTNNNNNNRNSNKKQKQ